MDFFSKVSDTLLSAGQEVAEKTKGMTDVAKLQYEKKSKENFLNKKYQEIGRMYFESNKDAFPEEYTGLFEEVKSTLDRISELSDEIAGKKGGKVCPKCGATVEANATFCSVCGAKIDDIFEDEDDVEVVEDEDVTVEDTVENE